jgi:DNA end-binding protein Ku
MSARAILKCSITFGMVTIPVALFAATSSKDIGFHRAHKDCGSRLQQKNWCPVDDREVMSDELDRVYEVSKGIDLIITTEDLDGLPVPSKKTIELDGFFDGGEVDAVYIDKSYWLEPDGPTAVKAYSLLHRALYTRGVVGIGKIAIRQREALCLIRPLRQVLVLETLFWPDEVRLAEMPELPEAAVSEQELGVALTVVDAFSKSFAPAVYQDDYRLALRDLIQRKTEGLPPAQQPQVLPLPTTDIMAALRATLDQLKQQQPPAEPVVETKPVRRRRKS